jgi:hypothetical protein
MSLNIWTVAILFMLFHSTASYRNGEFFLVFLTFMIFVSLLKLNILDGPPSLLVRPESKIVPVDTAVVLFCRAGGEPAPNIMWLSNGLIITDSRFVNF